jgi:alpha-beta hydrolase superfamily lysophospholipase
MKYLIALVAAIKVLWLGSRIQGDFPITKVDRTSEGTFVYLPVNEDTASTGELSLFWNSRLGHAIVKRAPGNSGTKSQRFEVLRNLGEDLRVTDGAWLSGWLGDKPEHFGFSSETNLVMLPNGTISFMSVRDPKTWVIHVHGRKASYAETLRNTKQFDELGFSQLAISHESDPKPNGLGKKVSHLGSTEWKQVEMAIDVVKTHGAERILIFGWSLGGLMVNQYLSRASVAEEVVGVIFDSPLLDYRSTLRLQAKREGYTEQMGDLVAEAITKSRLLRLLGFSNVPVDSLSALSVSLPVQIPTLLFYSLNDGYISMAGVFRYQKLNPTVSLIEIPGARHCRLFNEDSQKYQEAIAGFVKANL